MKLTQHWQYMLLLFTGLFVAVSACKNPDTPAPDPVSITSINPTSAPLGGTLTISGTSFNASPASNTVTFTGNAVAQIVSASPTQIVVTVPAGAQNGAITLNSGGTTVSSPSATPFQLSARPVVTVQGSISANTRWTANTIYSLRGFVYVTNNAVLTIDPGTIIRGGTRDQDPDAQNRGGTLIVERGSRLEAAGTAQRPIVFTSGRPAGQRGYGDWGGIVLIGRAPANQGTSRPLEGGIRGFISADAVANDNSGTLSFVRIEFPGVALSAQPNSEINGLTLYQVGSGTTINNVQVSYSGDDSFEWFGGTVNCRNLVALRGTDDDFDTDFGYIGRVQFAVSLRDPNVADQSGSCAFESDNYDPGEPAASANNGLPLTQPIFANVSSFGFAGATAPSTSNATSGSGPYRAAMHLRRNTAISIYNSVFTGWPEGLRLEGTATGTLNNANTGLLELQGITMVNVGVPNSTTFVAVRGLGAISNTVAQTYFNLPTRKNQVLPSTDIAALFNVQNYNLTAPSFLPPTGSALLTASDAITGGKLADSFFQPAPYRGAFGTTNWTAGWTNFDPQSTDYDR